MKDIVKKKPDERVLKRYQQLKQLLVEHRQQLDEDKLDKAFNLMCAAAGNDKDATCQSIVQSSLETAEIAVRDIGLGNTSLKSIFLHRTSLCHPIKNIDFVFYGFVI